jgi:hypothetical protein
LLTIHEPNVICSKNRWAQGKWKEARIIEKTANGIANRDNGRTLPDIYKMVLINNKSYFVIF